MLTIGRAATADVVLSDPTVSSIHARLQPLPKGSGWRIVDCHSRNGTLVNKRSVTERDLAIGDRIQIGAAVLVYTTPEGALETPPEPPGPDPQSLAPGPAPDPGNVTLSAPRAGAPGAPLGETTRMIIAAADPSLRPAPIGTLLDDDTETITVAPDDFDIDFLDPSRAPAERASEASLERRLVALYRAAKTLTPLSDRTPVEPRFVKLVSSILGVVRAAVLRVRDDRCAEAGHLEIVAAVVRPGGPAFADVPPQLKTVRESRRIGRALLFSRPAGRPDLKGGPSGAVVVPFQLDPDERLIAYADIFEPWPSLGADDLRLLGILARHAAACISNHRLRDGLVLRNGDLERRVEERSRALVEQSKLAAVGTLAAGIAHEFNNVLAVIMGNAELALELKADAAETQSSLLQIMEAAKRSKEIVQHVLTFARRREPRREPVNLVEVVEATLRLLATDLARAGARIRRSFAALPPVDGEPGQIALAVLQLVKNARDAIAAKPGGGELHISLSRRIPSGPAGGAAPGRVHAVLDVRDTGTGMPASVRERLFEPFFTTKPPGEATGLGLATAYGIVKNHGGTIEVTSAAGEGSTFRILLPMPVGEIVEAASPHPAPEDLFGPAAPALHVLVVDDDPAVRATIVAMVKRLKHHPTAVASGAEALSVYPAAHFDLVLVDQAMAGMDGLTVRAEIRKINPNQKVVLITGDAHVAELAAAHGLGPEGFVRKPFTFREIAELMARVAGK